MDKPMIEIKNLTKRYKDRDVLKALSMDVPSGCVCGLLGRNGEGKTTLIKTVLGLLKPTSGSLTVLSDDPWRFREGTKEKLGYVPQSDRLYPWLTVDQLINYTASFYQHWNKALVEQLINDWKINRNEKVGILSEGQAQKVSIILSLGHEPELLIFDEPVASLDPGARRQFLRTILEVVSGRPCTVFFSTHITTDLERVADRVAILHNGTIAFNGEMDTLKEKVKRLRIHAPKPLPPDLTLPGALYKEISGRDAIVCVRDFTQEIKDQAGRSWDASIQVEDLNLEEIFLEISR